MRSVPRDSSGYFWMSILAGMLLWLVVDMLYLKGILDLYALLRTGPLANIFGLSMAAWLGFLFNMRLQENKQLETAILVAKILHYRFKRVLRGVAVDAQNISVNLKSLSRRDKKFTEEIQIERFSGFKLVDEIMTPPEWVPEDWMVRDLAVFGDTALAGLERFLMQFEDYRARWEGVNKWRKLLGDETNPSKYYDGRHKALERLLVPARQLNSILTRSSNRKFPEIEESFDWFEKGLKKYAALQEELRGKKGV